MLVVAESIGQCLTAFDIAPDRALSNRRVFASTPGQQPDGICLDSDGNILVATMVGQQLMTFSSEGELLGIMNFDVPVWACAISDGGEILVCTSQHSIGSDCRRERSGAIQRVVA
jgi:sugar lactone lactonase YvrE